ncbi:unnamed protein product [Paramecium octaurelia]|uniref:MORN repeat protein n=1 Tax=Paramecium octaurelia TaxID=43137 RepID=A0A8S1RWK6_PAROT|nr:unnamed protein product [Paramecium octaurelia]
MMLQTKKSNVKVTVDQKFHNCIQKNVTDIRSDQGSSQKIPGNSYKVEKPSHCETTTKQTEPTQKQIPSLINQRKISDNSYQINPLEVTKCYVANSQLIQQLIQENIQLKKQNLAKDSIINQLITNNDISTVNQQRSSTSQTERQCTKQKNQLSKQKNSHKSMEELSSLGFTFCNTEQKNNQLESGQVSIKSSKSPIKLPKEFLIIPSQKKWARVVQTLRKTKNLLLLIQLQSKQVTRIWRLRNLQKLRNPMKLQVHPQDQKKSITGRELWKHQELSRSVDREHQLQIFDEQSSLALTIFNSLGPFPFPIIKDQTLTYAGPVQIEAGSFYMGQWSDGKRHGFGKQLYPFGSIYEGEWYNDQQQGYGRMVLPNGDYYEGEWRSDKAWGTGKYVTIDGTTYNGEWVDDKQHGKGVEEWKNGQKYEGNYLNGQKTGYGVFYWPDGSKYEGELLDGMPHGNGEYIWRDGKKYKGEWMFNQMHGYGIYIWPDGKIYKGNFEKDQREGYGELDWSDGRLYKGNWKNGKQHGEGAFIYKNKIRKGVWQNGQPTKWRQSEILSIQ